MTLPLAHVGHWLWILYLLPVLIVVIAGSSRSTLGEEARATGPATGDEDG